MNVTITSKSHVFLEVCPLRCIGLQRCFVDIMQCHAACGTDACVLQAARRSEPRGMDAVSMLLTPSLPWLRPACDGCRACPLILPPAVQQALPAIRRHLQA